MKLEKHQDALKEVKETIELALKDPRGLLPHQRRLSALISLGAAHLVETYLHKLNVLKTGTQIKHDWFGISKERIAIRLAASLTVPVKQVKDIDFVIELAREIESHRNELIYGPTTSEDIIRKKISLFLELQEVIEK